MVFWTESGQVRGQAICRSKLGDYYLVQGYRGNCPGNPGTETVPLFFKYYATAWALANDEILSSRGIWCSDRIITYALLRSVLFESLYFRWGCYVFKLQYLFLYPIQPLYHKGFVVRDVRDNAIRGN